LLLAYVDHHDAAYKWAERRKIERHPTTGAMQLVDRGHLAPYRTPTIPLARCRRSRPSTPGFAVSLGLVPSEAFARASDASSWCRAKVTYRPLTGAQVGLPST